MNTMRLRFAGLCLFGVGFLFLGAVGCVSARSERVGTRAYPPRPENHPIELLDALGDAGRPYVKVGRIMGRGGRSRSWDSVLEEMKAEARRIGADALVLGDEESEATYVTESGHILRKKNKTGLAIRWTEPVAPDPAAPKADRP